MTLHRSVSRLCLVLVAALVVANCAAPRPAAVKLAEAGIAASGALGTEVSDLSMRLGRLPAIQGVAKTLKLCRINPQQCSSLPQGEPELLNGIAEVQAAVAARKKVITQLGKAYKAFLDEANYDARGDLAGATKELADTTLSYAAVLGATPSAGLSAVPAVVGFLAGVFADLQQAQRLKQGSVAIREAVGELASLLPAEKDLFVALYKIVADAEGAYLLQLVHSGAVSRASILKPFSDSMGVPLLADADALIGKSPPLIAAVDAAAAVRPLEIFQSLVLRYDISVAALNSLLDDHKKFENERTFTSASLVKALGDIEALVTLYKSPPSQ